jgi:hypothetical protein
MTNEEFSRDALTILARELGVDGIARFLRLHRSGPGDYTEEHHRWLDGAEVSSIMAEVERRKRSPR